MVGLIDSGGGSTPEHGEWVTTPGTAGLWQTMTEGIILYLAHDRGAHYALAGLGVETGEQVWNSDIRCSIGGRGGICDFASTVTDDMYLSKTSDVATASGNVYAVAVTSGEVMWEREIAGLQSGPGRLDDAVVVGTNDGSVLGLDPGTGDIRWKTVVADRSFPRFHLGTNLLYVTTVGNPDLIAVDPADGNERWRYTAPTSRLGCAAVIDDTAYCYGKKEAMAIADGEEHWRATFENHISRRHLSPDGASSQIPHRARTANRSRFPDKETFCTEIPCGVIRALPPSRT